MIFSGVTAPDEILVKGEAETVDLRALASTNLVQDIAERHHGFESLDVRVVRAGVEGEERTRQSAARDSRHFRLVEDNRRVARRAFEVPDRATSRPRPATSLIDIGGVVRRVFPAVHARGRRAGGRPRRVGLRPEAFQPESERRDAC